MTITPTTEELDRLAKIDLEALWFRATNARLRDKPALPVDTADLIALVSAARALPGAIQRAERAEARLAVYEDGDRPSLETVQEDLRRATEYGVEANRLALEWRAALTTTEG